METDTTFLDWKNQYYFNNNSFQTDFKYGNGLALLQYVLQTNTRVTFLNCKFDHVIHLLKKIFYSSPGLIG